MRPEEPVTTVRAVGTKKDEDNERAGFWAASRFEHFSS
jgi:hypothetical protein